MIRSLNFWLTALLLVCAVSLFSAAGGPDLFRAPGPRPEAAPEEIPLPVHLRILNGAGVAGLARDVSLLVTAEGCVVEGVGNAEGPWPETVLVNRRLDEDLARALAQRLGGVALLQEWDERCREDAVLILGDDHGRVRRALGGGKPDQG